MRRVVWHLCGRFWAVMAGRAWARGETFASITYWKRSEVFFQRIRGRV